jgi:signal transduction histidine kinase
MTTRSSGIPSIQRMHNQTNIRWAVLFGAMILIPTAVLAILSMRTLLNEDRNALVDLQIRLPALQARFLDMVEQLVEDERSGTLESNPHFLFRLRIDRDGLPLSPRYVSLSATRSRSEAYTSASAEGTRLELQDKNPRAAATLYEAAILKAGSDAERSGLRNLLGRALVSMGESETAEVLQETMWQTPDVFGPDGEHPVSMSVLRLLRTLPSDSTKLLAKEWLELFIQDRTPMFPGFVEYVSYAEIVLDRRGLLSRSVKKVVREVEDRLQFAEGVSVLKPSGGRFGSLRIYSGKMENGNTLLALLNENGRGLDGVAVDVTQITKDLAAEIPDYYGIKIFDLDAAATVDAQTKTSVRTIAPVSDQVYRVNLILYARDRARLLGELRDKRGVAVAGVVGLAALIGFGVVLVYRMTAREMALGKLRSEFVSTVSHEFRTPLQSILLHAETLSLKRYRDEAQLDRYLDTITRESKRLSRLVGNVLDFSRIESGRQDYRLEPTVLADTVRNAVEELRGPIEDAGFQVDASYTGDTTALADHSAVDSAVANLIANAVKYSGDGSEIGVSVAGQEDSVTIEVLDRGIGVAEADREEIFEKFKRGRNAGDVTGTGLGLALVKDVMIGHGGTAEVVSRDGGGSVLRLRFIRGIST